MGFKSDGIRWKWDDSYTTTSTTGDPIEIKAPEWKIGDKITFNSPIDIGIVGEPKGWICPRCGRANAPWVSQCGCNAMPWVKVNTSPAFTASPCQTCSNNPANGGSGNCNCTLGTCPVIC